MKGIRVLPEGCNQISITKQSEIVTPAGPLGGRE
jgi:hypothetical protein